MRIKLSTGKKIAGGEVPAKILCCIKSRSQGVRLVLARVPVIDLSQVGLRGFKPFGEQPGNARRLLEGIEHHTDVAHQ